MNRNKGQAEKQYKNKTAKLKEEEKRADREHRRGALQQEKQTGRAIRKTEKALAKLH